MTALALNVDSASGAEGDVIAHMPPQLAAALFVGSVTLGTASAGGFASSLLDISAEYSGFLYGLTTVVCASCGALGVYTTGWILDETHSFSAVFACTAAVYTLGEPADREGEKGGGREGGRRKRYGSEIGEGEKEGEGEGKGKGEGEGEGEGEEEGRWGRRISCWQRVLHAALSSILCVRRLQSHLNYLRAFCEA